jgi:hypothetical protein
MEVERMIYTPLEVNEECGSCGADIGPSSTFPWHSDEEDCRACREPLEAPMLISRLVTA